MIWNIGGNMKRIINLVFTLIVSILLLVACDAATGNNSNESTKEESQKLEAGNAAPENGYLRIHWNGVQANAGDSTTWSVWVFNDVETPSGSNGEAWPDGYFFTHCDDFGLYLDVKLNSNPQSVGLVVVNRADGVKGSSDTDVLFKFPQKYNEIYRQLSTNTL